MIIAGLPSPRIECNVFSLLNVFTLPHCVGNYKGIFLHLLASFYRMSNQFRITEDAEGSSKSWNQIPGCCASCHVYEDLRNQLEPDCNVHMRALILLNASKNGHVECVKACLADGIEIKPWRKAALFDAVKKGSVARTEWLLKPGANVNTKDKNKETALFVAVRESSVQCTDLLLKAGANVNIRDKNGETALFATVRSQSVRCTDLLPKAGADVNIQDIDDKTALFIAIIVGSPQCTDLLLNAGANVNIKDQWGKTALFDAVCWGSVQCTDMLLKAGADVNATDQYGDSVLFLDFLDDVWSEVLNIIKMLLSEGIKVNIRNCYGSNALTNFLNSTGKKSANCKFAMLLLSAGETVDKDGRMKLLQLFNQNDDMVPMEASEYLTLSAEISLKNICRETIRKHLLQMSQVNLFVRVPRLPLPQLMTSYLLYDVTLDDEEKDSQSNSDSDSDSD